MPEEHKTFKVVCAYCDRAFHVRFPLSPPGVEGAGGVVVKCLCCDNNVVVPVPQKYIAEEGLLMGIKGVPAAG